MTPSRLLIMGPPGVGKGTQAARLADSFGVPAISTGDMFRAHARNRSDLGLAVAELIAAGEYIPDEITNQMVELRLAEADATAGYILDGYPRTVAQVHRLDSMLAASGTSLDAVILLVVRVDEIVARLAARGQSGGRADDIEAVVRHRIDVYERETALLSELYGERGLLVPVDGIGAPDEITHRITRAMRND